MTSFTTGPIGLPFSQEMGERIKQAISGVFRGVHTEAPRTTASRPAVATIQPSMSCDSKSSALAKIKAAERAKRISPGLARSAEELVRAGKFSPSDVDALLEGLSRQPIGAIAYTDTDDDE